jgi:GMP synthase (glutamine-hydrolysing)
LVLDFGGQYTQLIARRIRECRVFSEILPFDSDPDAILARHPRGIVLSGGPDSVYEPDAPRLEPSIYGLGIPVLGICYGHQLMAHQLGGDVRRAEREYGHATLSCSRSRLLEPGERRSWMSHGDQVAAAPAGFQVTGVTETCPVAAMEAPDMGLYGVQFHPEVTHTERGQEVIRRFVLDVCGCRPDWTPEHFVDQAVGELREKVGEGRAVCGVSGGVDSCVVAALASKALHDRLTCIFVDHGLMRKGEPEDVKEAFGAHYDCRFVAVDAAERFLKALGGVTDPEEKRRIIGAEFIRVFEESAAEVGECDWLIQGTLYPDVIESGSRVAARIKSHHNVGGLPEWMRLKVVEPLRYLFKDEVRAVGRELGLPEGIVERQPFPGPGLAVRILGEVTPERVERLREADAIVREELKRSGVWQDVWQSFAALLDVRSVGVMGDARTYENPVVVRAVSSEDAMTATAVRVPWESLERIATRIVNEVPGINRVLYDLTSKPPATIEWE